MVAYIPKLEDITGQSRPSEEELPELVDADSSDTSPERRRMVTETELKPPRWSQSECDGRMSLGFYEHIRNRIIINMTSLHYNAP